MTRFFRISAVVFVLSVFTVWSIPVSAQNNAVDRAVQRGVQYLRSAQADTGAWFFRTDQNQLGPTALAALTLLECGVPANDNGIQSAAMLVREQSVSLTATYSLALAIMFLDRLGDPADTPLIQAMGVRLVAGQSISHGGWAYTCPVVGDEAELRRLSQIVQLRRGAAPLAKPATPPKKRPELPKEIRDQLIIINQQTAVQAQQGIEGPGGDNSNTQFAMLGLWIARRHGVPVTLSLERSAARYRLTQNADGGWGYMVKTPSSPPMTCAGLLGLALGIGVANEAALQPLEPKEEPEDKDKTEKTPAKKAAVPRRPARKPIDYNRDPAVRGGLLALASAIGEPFDMRELERLPRQRGRLERGHYFLWSMERVAVAFDLKTIGRKDWYTWGAQILIASQEINGSWSGEYPGPVDTCLALLFLRRSNLAGDLTANLKGKINDPGEVVLRSGGLGETLKPKGLSSGVQFTDSSKENIEEKKDKADARITPESDAARLGNEIISASPNQQETLLAQLKDSRGVSFTQALAEAIPRLSGPVKTKARDALAERLSRMTSATIKDKLRDENLEVRRAAALACAMREDKENIPDLIELLKDEEQLVARASHAALKELSGKDFGPTSSATPDERDYAISKWREWWKKQPTNK